MIIGALVVITIVGLGVGKWVHKAGGVLMLVTFAALLLLPWLNLRARHARRVSSARRPRCRCVSIMSLNLLGKMGFGALGGFEYVAIHAGECRNPVRTIGRSVVVAAPIIAVMFILGTSSVLALVPQDQIDLIAPIPQVLSVGFGPLGVAAAIAPITILALLCIRLAQASVMFAGNTRLPMVAGWDGLLPEWFTRMHPRYQDAGQLDPLRRRGDARVQHRRADRRRQAGSVSAALERVGDLLRADLSRDVRDSARRPARSGRRSG